MPLTDETMPAVIGDRGGWPASAEAMMASLENRFPPLYERRKLPRTKYNAEASLVLAGAAAPAGRAARPTLYVRDVNPWSAGFIVGVRLAGHARGAVTLRGPTGETIQAACLVRRCREFAPGWYDGVLEFDHEQRAFAGESFGRAA